MKKQIKIVTGMLTLIMAAALLFGCAPKTTTEPSTAPSNATASAAPGASTGVTDIAKHEVYTMANRIPWSTVVAPGKVSRASIDKAIKADNRKDKVKVGYATWTVGTPFFAAMRDTIQAECDKYGYELVITVTDQSVDKHLAALENFVTIGVDVIIDNSMDINAETPQMKAVVAAGIPVIGLGLAFPSEVPLITTVAVNYYDQGFLLGQYYADLVKDKDVKGAMIPGMIGHTISESKMNGFLGGFIYQRAINMDKPFTTKEDAMLTGYNLWQEIVKNTKFSSPEYKFEIVASVDGYWSQEGGLKAAEDILTAHQDINLFMCDNDQEGFGAIKALQQVGLKAGSDVKVVSVGDGTKECMQLIKDGTYTAVALQGPYTEAKACVDLIYKIFHDGFDATNLPFETDLENVIVTKDNVDKYLNENPFATLNDAVFTPLG